MKRWWRRESEMRRKKNETREKISLRFALLM